MLGRGPNQNTMYPNYSEDIRVQYDSSTLPQLQLFGHDPIQRGTRVAATNYVERGNVLPPINLPTKRVREGEPAFTQQKLHISSNNNLCRDEAGNIITMLNSNHVSTGLRLSRDEDEHNFAIAAAYKNSRTVLPGSLSMGSTAKQVIDLHAEEISHYIKLQEENMLKGVRELNQRHTISLLNVLEQGVNRKLQEKEMKIVNIHLKNKELGDRIKHVATEAQAWHYKAKCNESVVNVLKNNIQQLMVQGAAQAREGSGESEEDDAVSCTNNHSASGNHRKNDKLKCRSCGRKEVSVLLLPCRHLCLCTDCESLVSVCPVCQVMKTSSVHVYM